MTFWTLVSLTVPNMNLTLLVFKIRQFGIKIKSDLLEYVNTSQLEGTEYESDTGILRFFIQNLNLGKLVQKLKPI